MPKLVIGDRVAYSVQWLRSIGVYSGELPALRGRIKAFKPMGRKTIAVVEWTDGETSSALVQNLAKVGPNRQFCNCD